MSQELKTQSSGLFTSAKGVAKRFAPGVVGRAEKVVQVAHDTLSPLPVPERPDGLTDAQAAAPSDAPHELGFMRTIFKQVKDRTLATDLGTVLKVGRSAVGPLDDRELLLEDLVDLLAGLPANTSLGKSATDQFSKMLYDDLPHPPIGFVGASKFRSADGGGNNPFNPDLGRAGQPYARSVPPDHPKPATLPDAGVVFDALLKRDKFVPHPSGISSLLFAFATLIVHTIFSTNPAQPAINQTSAYLDLSILYGRNQDEQDRIRDRSTGYGLIYPDTVSSSSLFMMPPQVVAFLVVFARNHNSIAKTLFAINESGKFKSPDSLSKDAPPSKDSPPKPTQSPFAIQDDTLFETARLINCGWFINVIFQDYIKAILNLNKSKTEWSLIPLGNIRTFPSGTVPRGTGNAVSVEFNLLYRWHCCISERDEKWLIGVFQSVLGTDKSPDDYTRADFMQVMAKYQPEPGKEQEWTIPGLKRGEDGQYADDDLVELLSASTDEIAGAYKARGIPAVMRVIEEMGIEASRSDWAVCTLNEFRKFLNLETFDKFTQWNEDPEIAATAEKLWGHPDNIELHAGLAAEQPKESRSGSGLCPGYTISRAILSDAVGLTRADRYCTTDWNAAAHTNWGFEQVQPDTKSGAYGGILGGLLMRTFPDFYTFNSAYALYAFSTPATQKEFLTAMEVVDEYDFTRPKRKAAQRAVKTLKAAEAVLNDTNNFAVVYGPSNQVIAALATELAFFDCYTGTARAPTFQRERQLVRDAFQPQGWQKLLDDVFATATDQLIKQAAWTYDDGKTHNLDLVRDVVQMVPIEWAANALCLPIKSDRTAHGLSAREWFTHLSNLYAFVYLDLPVHDQFKARATALASGDKLHKMIVAVLRTLSGELNVSNLTRDLLKKLRLPTLDGLEPSESAKSFYDALLRTRQPIEALANVVLSVLVETVVPLAQDLANVFELVLTSSSKAELASMTRLATGARSAQADKDLLGYIDECLRMAPPLPSIRRECLHPITIQDGPDEVSLAVGEIALIDVHAANHDPVGVTNPEGITILRTRPFTPLLPSKLISTLARELNDVAMTAVVRTVLKLDNLKLAKGKQGSLNRIIVPGVSLAQAPTYMSPTGVLVPLPVSLGVIYG